MAVTSITIENDSFKRFKTLQLILKCSWSHVDQHRFSDLLHLYLCESVYDRKADFKVTLMETRTL